MGGRVDFRLIRPIFRQNAPRPHSSDVIARLDPTIYLYAKEMDPRGSSPQVTRKRRINFIGIR